jgi:hypothetical protein
VSDLPIHISWFPTAFPDGPAYGDPETTTWAELRSIIADYRREDDEKDGSNFIPARFQLELDGKRVRRLGRNLIARTAIAMDIEYNKDTREWPPMFNGAVAMLRQTGWAAVVYTSHNHTLRAPRYRIVLPLSEEIDHQLPAVEVIAGKLQLAGVLDRSKVGASSLFYLPSCPPGRRDQHYAAAVNGDPISAAWIREAAGKILAERKAEQDRLAAEAHAQAKERRRAKVAAGFDPDDSLIEKIRTHLDLEQILVAHGYDRDPRGNFRHPNSQSGSFGASIRTFGGVERVYSHNAGDPLHRGNLPAWATVAAVDAVDATTILDYGGDRTRGLHELAKRFGLDKRKERSELSSLLFSLIRQQADQDYIEACALAAGQRLGLSRAEVIDVALWVESEATKRKAA